MFRGELEAEGTDSVDNDDLELVADFGHETTDLFYQAVDRSFIASLEETDKSKTLDGKIGQTLSNVVMAYVATLRFVSVIRFSMSTLQVATLVGCEIASEASVRVAANFRTGFGDDKKSWRTEKARIS